MHNNNRGDWKHLVYTPLSLARSQKSCGYSALAEKPLFKALCIGLAAWTTHSTWPRYTTRDLNLILYVKLTQQTQTRRKPPYHQILLTLKTCGFFSSKGFFLGGREGSGFWNPVKECKDLVKQQLLVPLFNTGEKPTLSPLGFLGGDKLERDKLLSPFHFLIE